MFPSIKKTTSNHSTRRRIRIFPKLKKTRILQSQTHHKSWINSYHISWKHFTGKGRKNETEVIFAVLLQMIWGHLQSVSNTQAVYNYEQLAYTVNIRFEMSQVICKSTTNIIIVSLFLPIPVNSHFQARS